MKSNLSQILSLEDLRRVITLDRIDKRIVDRAGAAVKQDYADVIPAIAQFGYRNGEDPNTMVVSFMFTLQMLETWLIHKVENPDA